MDDGSVNMYEIKFNDTTGYVYGKYLTAGEEDALKVYNENGVYDIHKDRKYKSRELYGGKASTWIIILIKRLSLRIINFLSLLKVCILMLVFLEVLIVI